MAPQFSCHCNLPSAQRADSAGAGAICRSAPGFRWRVHAYDQASLGAKDVPALSRLPPHARPSMLRSRRVLQVVRKGRHELAEGLDVRHDGLGQEEEHHPRPLHAAVCLSDEGPVHGEEVDPHHTHEGDLRAMNTGAV